MLRFQILGETPGKKNSKIWTKSGKLIPSAKHQKWHTDAMLQVTGQVSRLPKDEWPYGPEHPNGLEDPVAITLTFYHGTRYDETATTRQAR